MSKKNYGLFGIAFEGLKSAFNTQKSHLKKKYSFGKQNKIKALLRIQKT
jgi:hypothetical protein